MSLVGTLAKVAVGILVAKTVGGMMGGGRSGGGDTGGGLGDILSGRTAGRGTPYGGSRSPRGREGDALRDVMRDALGQGTPPPRGPDLRGRDPLARDGGPVVAEEPGSGPWDAGRRGGGQGGGLGDLLEQLGGATGRPGMDGGLGGILDRMGKGGGGGLGDILGGILGGAAAGGAASRGGRGFGDVLSDAFGQGGEPQVQPTAEQNAAAGLLLSAMVQAAKSDGRIDAAEQKKLMENLGDATPEEMQFVRGELKKPIDVDGLCRQVPEALAPQVYAMSVMAIDFDNQSEARYLDALARGLGLAQQDVNAIHRQMGLPALYR